MSFARAASLREKKSAVFSRGLRLKERAAKKAACQKEAEGCFSMKRLLVSLRVWMVFLMNWVTPDRKTAAAAVYSAQRTYQRKAAVQAAGLVSFYEWRMAVNDEEKQKAKAAALYKRRCLQAFKESPKQERAGPHLYMAVKRR